MEEIDLKELFNIFWSKKIFIIVITILFAVLGLFYTKYMVKPVYQSTATLVLTKSDNTEGTTITQTEVTLNQQLVATYTELMKTNNILRQVIQNLGYEDMTEESLRQSVAVQLVSSTQLIEVSVKNSNPERAKELTNEMAKVFIAKAIEIYKLDNIHIVDEAKVATAPYNINHKKDVLMFTIVGFILSLGFVFIRSLFDTTIKNSEEVEKRLGLTTLAFIPQYDYEMKKKAETGKELMIDQDPKSPIAEVFRTLRTNLQFMTSNQGLKTLLVTSSVPGEGKSWVSANLAVAFAKEGKKVALIDSDMRKGRLHTIFELDKKPGLSNYLSGVSELEDKEDLFAYFKKTNTEGLYVMPAGDVPPNPSELLVSEKMPEFISKLKNTFDMVIFDGTPVILVTDSVILARQLDSSLIVTSYKSTKMGDVEKIKKMIENVGGKIAGIVINKMPVAAKKYESTYYYGNYEEDNPKEKKKIGNVGTDSEFTQEEDIKSETEKNQEEKTEETTNIEDEILKEIEEFTKKEDQSQDS